jgi:hypothetical protein
MVLAPEVTEATWTLENFRSDPVRASKPFHPDNVKDGKAALEIDESKRGDAAGAWYSSFVVQHDDELVEKVLGSLPVATIPPPAPSSTAALISPPSAPPSDGSCDDVGVTAGTESEGADADGVGGGGDGNRVTHGRSIWLFFGRNRDGKGPMRGRSEHTDAVAHSATWHLQVAGRKVWYIRPTDELLRSNGLTRLSVLAVSRQEQCTQPRASPVSLEPAFTLTKVLSPLISYSYSTFPFPVTLSLLVLLFPKFALHRLPYFVVSSTLQGHSVPSLSRDFRLYTRWLWRLWWLCEM